MLKRITKAVTVTVTIICLVCCWFPVQAFAVDPMSAAMAANAFAQAIAAYGASQGASMTFDVSNTDGIGEGVHELWQDFRASQNAADDFQSAAAIFQSSSPYAPQNVNIAGQTLKVVGINIDETVKPMLDDFWNWLMTGPAEMVKVDNSYYQFSQNQIGPDAVPIGLNSSFSYVFGSIPLFPLTETTTLQYGNTSSVVSFRNVSPNTYFFYQSSSQIPSTSNLVIIHDGNGSFGYRIDTYSWNTASINYQMQFDDGSGTYIDLGTMKCNWPFTSAVSPNVISSQPYQIPAGYGVSSSSSVMSVEDAIGLKSYGNTGVAEFPDTDDENYDAIHPPIPVGIPWDDSLFGDGTGTLTDAQTHALVNELTDALADTGEIELAEEGVEPLPDPGEVYVPLLPVALPNFNFNLSGIWHYVREWVSSLGAWLTTLFSIWSALPYAMVVPVYATAVVVIVLGVYKRFFM